MTLGQEMFGKFDGRIQKIIRPTSAKPSRYFCSLRFGRYLAIDELFTTHVGLRRPNAFRFGCQSRNRTQPMTRLPLTRLFFSDIANPCAQYVIVLVLAVLVY